MCPVNVKRRYDTILQIGRRRAVDIGSPGTSRCESGLAMLHIMLLHNQTNAISVMHSHGNFSVMTLPTCQAKLVFALIRCILLPSDWIHPNNARAGFGRRQALLYQIDLLSKTNEQCRLSYEHTECLGVQDVAAALILSEAVYKALDGSINQAVETVTSILAGLPDGLRQPLKVQWSLPHVAHRCNAQHPSHNMQMNVLRRYNSTRCSPLMTNTVVYPKTVLSILPEYDLHIWMFLTAWSQ